MRAYSIVLTLALLISGTLSAQSPSAGRGRLQSPAQARLEQAARSANANNDETSIRALAHEVFSQPHHFPAVPDFLASLVKDRFARAEIAYRQARSKGVTEAQVTDVANVIADSLSAPALTRTTKHQVRVLRLTLLVSSPSFMGRGILSGGSGVGRSIPDQMSPLQAAHLLMTLADQKLLNPEYQLSPREWEHRRYQKSTERWEAAKNAAASGVPLGEPGNSVVRLSGQTMGTHRAVANGLDLMSPADALVLAERVLNMLGIDR